jgi:hypothetical protein
MVELTAGNAPLNAFGMYNCSPAAPPLYQVFPGAAADGWFAVASFRTAPIRVVVNLFDNNAVIQGTTTYLGADKNNFGFYLQGPDGTFYSQDARNGGNAQAVTYAGTGTSTGQWWLCWEDESVAAGSDRDFEDMIIFLESVSKPVPTKGVTWGDLKSRY